MWRKLTVFTALLVLSVSTAQAADVAGLWTITMTGPHGEETFPVTITAEGTRLALIAKHPNLGEMRGMGAVDGTTVTMNLASTGPMGIAFAFSGTVEGNTMSGTREMKPAAGGRPGGPGGPGGGLPGGIPPGGGSGGGPGGGMLPGEGPGGPVMKDIPNTWKAQRQ